MTKEEPELPELIEERFDAIEELIQHDSLTANMGRDLVSARIIESRISILSQLTDVWIVIILLMIFSVISTASIVYSMQQDHADAIITVTEEEAQPTPYIVTNNKVFVTDAPTVQPTAMVIVITATATALPTATQSPADSPEIIKYDKDISLALNKLVVGRRLVESLMVATQTEGWSLQDDYRWNFKFTYAMNLIHDGIGDLGELDIPDGRKQEVQDYLTDDAVVDLIQATEYGWEFFDGVVVANQQESAVDWEQANSDASLFFLNMNDAFRNIARWGEAYRGDLPNFWELSERDYTFEVETDG